MAIETLTDLDTFHDFSCIELTLGGSLYFRAQSFNWSDKNDSTDVYGASRTKIGDTPGQYSAEGSFDLLLEDGINLIKTLKSRYDSKFDIIAKYSIGGVATHVISIPKCKLLTTGNDNSVGTDALKLSFTFKSNDRVKIDDLDPVSPTQSLLGDILRGANLVQGAIKSF